MYKSILTPLIVPSLEISVTIIFCIFSLPIFSITPSIDNQDHSNHPFILTRPSNTSKDKINLSFQCFSTLFLQKETSFTA